MLEFWCVALMIAGDGRTVHREFARANTSDAAVHAAVMGFCFRNPGARVVKAALVEPATVQ